MKIAVEGCCHGELDAIYAQVAELEQRNGYKIELLLICGDFQAIRNLRDLQCMAVPDKYRQLGGFCKYYAGEKTAPVLTVIIGGNHEASNYLWELYHGGWVAPNIYFLGHAGCVQVNGMRIAGASGIFKGQDFRQGHWERLPFDHGAMRSIYHIREFNVRRLSLLSPPTIFLSHDWPQSIAHHGDLAGLLRRKPYFREDIARGALGSPPLMGLLRTLRPKWWFAAHLHCRFEAVVVHPPTEGAALNPDEIATDDASLDETGTADAGAPAVEAAAAEEEAGEPAPAAVPRNADEIVLDDLEEDVAPPPPPPPPACETRFLALDKCLPRRQFLEVIDVDTPEGPRPGGRAVLAFDPEWLAITRAFSGHASFARTQQTYPDEAAARSALRDAREWVRVHVLAGRAAVPVSDVQTFAVTAPVAGGEGGAARQQPPYYPNPQTAAFCAMLQIENKIDAVSLPSPPPPSQG